jgi:hypothetical protein
MVKDMVFGNSRSWFPWVSGAKQNFATNYYSCAKGKEKRKMRDKK